MSRQHRPSCPPWCIADHPREDEGGKVRHRGKTSVVTGVAFGDRPPHAVESIELLIELHADDGDPVVGVYIGDGLGMGFDVTTETASRLVRRLVETLHSAGGPAL
jgi:hypothetical protein